MIDRDERRVGDDIERLFAAVIGVGTPADVGEQTGRMAQSLPSAVSSRPDVLNEAIRPLDQLLDHGAVSGSARH